MRRLGALAPDARGSGVAEFAILLPVMLIAVMGASEVTYQAYLQAMIEGAVQQAARSSTIQGGAERAADFDAQVTTAVRRLNKTAVLTFDRQNYATFLAIAPERYDDNNNNNRRDPGECFDDINKNSTWDVNPGTSGQGGANDVAAYYITVTYSRIFPISAKIGWAKQNTLRFTTYLKNQPYATQAARAVTQVCT